MGQPTPEPAPRPKPKDPFGPPLDASCVREVFRRLRARPWAEQQAFVAKVNWNLLDEASEHHLMAWLVDALRSGQADRQVFAVAILSKLPHPKRARHAPRFQAVMGQLAPETATQVADAFGPILGGAPKRSTRSSGKPQPAPNKAPAAPAQPEPAREVTGEDLAKLKDFFGKFGGAR